MPKMVKGVIAGDDFLTEVLIRGLTLNGPADAYYIGNCSNKFAARLISKCGVHVLRNMSDFIQSSAVIFFTCKEDEIKTLFPQVAAKIKPWTLIVSALRNVELETLESYFPNNEIIRLIVNPSVISGSGLGAYVVSTNSSPDASSIAQMVLKDCGEVIAVKNEQELMEINNYLQANTYLAYTVVQLMSNNAKLMGMEPKEAAFSVNHLLKGAVRTLLELGGDTTDLALKALTDEKLHKQAVDLIKQYGFVDDLNKALTEPEVKERPEFNDDPGDYKMHYRWSR